ncbi:MAG: sigma-E processing peptidase SpoIIGA [Oscillospiraceae bacterium]|nr:sigma-E processing peptidase SpoIIGA [Oscillospiraceae bacterium]
MTIYADVLVILNLYINYFLIRSTALLLRREVSAKRCLPGALLGALGALVILLPELPFVVVALEKIALGAIITFAVFGKQKPADFAVCALFFLVVSFIFAGLAMALWTFAAPYGMVYANGVFSFNIPLAAIAAFTAAAYFTIRLVRYFSDRRLRQNRICSVMISADGVEVTLKGLCDTGNELRDIFTGKPVIVCELKKISGIVPQNISDYLGGKFSGEGIRLIPCKTVSSETLLPVFKAEKILIDGKAADAMIGVTQNALGEDIDCILDPKIISI